MNGKRHLLAFASFILSLFSPFALFVPSWFNHDIPELTLAKVWQAQWFVPGPWRTTDGRGGRRAVPGAVVGGIRAGFRGRAYRAGRAGDAPGRWRFTVARRIGGRTATISTPPITPSPSMWCWKTTVPHARTRDGRTLPTLALAPLLAGSLADFPAGTAPLGGLGDTPCARDFLATGTADLLRVLGRAGDERLALKAAAMEARFAAMPPGDVLYAAFLDALGYSANRAPMAALAAALPLRTLETALLAAPASAREATAAALLLGTGGFLGDSLPAFVLHGDRLRDMWHTMETDGALPFPVGDGARPTGESSGAAVARPRGAARQWRRGGGVDRRLPRAPARLPR